MLTYPRTLRSGAGSATTPRRRRQNFGRNQALRAGFLKSLAVELTGVDGFDSAELRATIAGHDVAIIAFFARVYLTVAAQIAD